MKESKLTNFQQRQLDKAMKGNDTNNVSNNHIVFTFSGLAVAKAYYQYYKFL